MERQAFAFRSGCLVLLLAPTLALVLYPRAKWLWGVAFLALLQLIAMVRLRGDVSAQSVAENAEKLLLGSSGRWAVDDYEHLNPRDPQVSELWTKTMTIGGLPENWPSLEEEKKAELRKVIEELRKMKPS